ncbi:PAS domain S-box protein [Siccirubricoccus sp. G192]|nr:cache domain-containing protein [Siccirubricoccus sp. G192]MBV1799149.1 PAS domain S-box protein [Siccirubricoccus sp. G192]
MRGASLWAEYQAALDRTEAGARDLARMVEEYARRSFETSDLIADAMAVQISALGGTAALRGNAAVHRWLRRLAERTSGNHLMVVDAAGMPVATSADAPVPAVTLADRGWFQAHLAGAQQHLGEAALSRFSKEILFTYSRALYAPDGTLDGVALVAIRPGFFQDPTFSTETTAGTILTMWDLQGRVIARTGLRPEDIGRPLAQATPFERFRDTAAGTLRTKATIDGRERILAHRRLPDWPVIVTVGIPVESGLALFHRNLVWSLWLTGAVLAGLIALTWFAAAVGRREERAEAELAAANAALLRARDDLERRVAERTRDLAEANHRLRESEARFRGIFNATFQFVGLLSPDGTLLEANETALAFIGRRPEEVVGRPFWETPLVGCGRGREGKAARRPPPRRRRRIHPLRGRGPGHRGACHHHRLLAQAGAGPGRAGGAAGGRGPRHQRPQIRPGAIARGAEAGDARPPHRRGRA